MEGDGGRCRSDWGAEAGQGRLRGEESRSGISQMLCGAFDYVPEQGDEPHFWCTAKTSGLGENMGRRW